MSVGDVIAEFFVIELNRVKLDLEHDVYLN